MVGAGGADCVYYCRCWIGKEAAAAAGQKADMQYKVRADLQYGGPAFAAEASASAEQARRKGAKYVQEING